MNEETRQAEAQREEYLANVTRMLRSRMSPLESYESVEELRAHITAMAAAYQEMGLEPHQAMELALQRFGSADTIGKGLATASSTPAKPRFAMPLAVPIVLVASTLLGGFLMKAVDLSFMAIFPTTSPTPPEVDLAISFFVCLVVAPVGWLMRKRPALHCGLLGLLVMNGALFLTLYRTYMSLHRDAALLFLVVSLSVAIFTLCTFASAFARVVERRYAYFTKFTVR